MAETNVTISKADFDVLYEAMELANNPYEPEDVPHLVALEARSWAILQAARAAQV